MFNSTQKLKSYTLQVTQFLNITEVTIGLDAPDKIINC